MRTIYLHGHGNHTPSSSRGIILGLVLLGLLCAGLIVGWTSEAARHRKTQNHVLQLEDEVSLLQMQLKVELQLMEREIIKSQAGFYYLGLREVENTPEEYSAELRIVAYPERSGLPGTGVYTNEEGRGLLYDMSYVYYVRAMCNRLQPKRLLNDKDIGTHCPQYR